ncbi:Fic family protein [Hydrogenoanaerobacterium sp.]|uniref:Fic family protein n=1 Tax=Hydrogenoanaerobacterium sp. TaxID=2953763 RepID=UPI00289C03CA|nr:Fic family protein [Hydrogenoanaerobacterium sp.]
MMDRAGKLKTNLSGEAAYKSFTPSPLPPNPPVELDNETVELLVKANKQLALLEGIAVRIPNVNLFISMYVRKEALMSSQIEGTQATLEDVLDPLIDENANRNVADVINYIKATDFAIARLNELPLCNRLIKEAHAVLMAGVRGQEKNPGEFRYSQNWIGGQGSTLKNARFIPPTPEDMTAAMSDLEKYINGDDALDVLIRAALIHYQFETIHPFLDGNGRIGRLLITLYLMAKGVLTTPALYISYFLKKNRIEYYDRMSEVRRNGNYEQWIKFFLQAIYECAEDATDTIDKLTALHNKNIAAISGMGRAAKTALRLFAYLEGNPIIEIQKTAVALDTTFKTVSDSVRRLCEMGILTQNSGEQRNRTFSYAAYLDILREGTV